uniref:FUSC family protein n=1 Tax=Geminicoccus flavidas TaxID=2506407 RepID=UPI00190FBA78
MKAGPASRLGLDGPLVAHGLRLAFAAWLAFTIATLLGIPHPYWAAMPIWVVAQPHKGLLFERAFFRVAGTLVGAGFGFSLVHLVGQPWLQLLLLAVWIAINGGLTHILRGVHGYGALLSGITAAVVVLPTLFFAEDATGTAQARVICTLIGVVVVTLLTGFFTPASPRQELYDRVRRLS